VQIPVTFPSPSPVLLQLELVRHILIVRFGSEVRTAEVWCSGLTCSPVKAEIAGSNPVTSAGWILSQFALKPRPTGRGFLLPR
jgi:hypothetical protein